jgi:hypothetical protein
MWCNCSQRKEGLASGKWRWFFSSTIVYVLLLAPSVKAQERSNDGVRSGGMGGAFAGISDDVNGIRTNPSGLVYSPQRLMFEFSTENLFSSGSPFSNNLINEGNVALFMFGLVYNHLEKPNRTIPVLAMAGSESFLPLQNNENNANPMPTSNVFSVGMMGSFLNTGFLNQMALRVFLSKGFLEKRQPNSMTNHRPHWIALSFTGKLWGYQYDTNIVEKAQVNTEAEREAIRDFFSDNGHSQYSLGLDLGASVYLTERAQAGLALNNVVQPNLGLASASKFPRSIRGGLAILLKSEWQWLVAVDLEKQEKIDAPRFFLGTESLVPKLRTEALKLRLGANQNWFSTGFKVAVRPIDVNYAFLFFLQDEGLYSHRLSLSWSKGSKTNGSDNF